MIAKAPVLWLSGTFGSGKTSTLHLLREHLGDKTITVSSSSWLPGSAETLTSYLLADIANERKKGYVVPGLRQSARWLAAALGRRVPVRTSSLAPRPDDLRSESVRFLRLLSDRGNAQCSRNSKDQTEKEIPAIAIGAEDRLGILQILRMQGFVI